MTKSTKMLTLGAVIAAIFLLAVVFSYTAHASSLSWDYPGDAEWEHNLVDYNIYYNNPGGDQFNKTINKSDVSANSTRVTYEDIDNKLQLQYNVEYAFHLTAFDVGQESVVSNYCTYTRTGYSPPVDALPPIVIHILGPLTITIGD